MKSKWISFFKQNGFLIFLFISVLIVASGTILIATENLRIARGPAEDELVILEEVVEDSEVENVEVSRLDKLEVEEIEESQSVNEETIVEKSNEDEDVEENLASKDVIDKKEEIVVQEVVKEKESVKEAGGEVEEKNNWILPLEGQILTEFSMDKLVYSKTLDEWRAHTGLDIGGKLGDKVKAPGNGIIKVVKEDDLWGITIIIDHGDGIESRIANLGTMEMVKEGLEVKCGDVISTVGKSAGIEMTMGPHVHYELYKNGKIINPRSITY